MMTPEQQIKQQLAMGTRAQADVANYEAKMRLAKALQEKQVSRSPDGFMSPFSIAAKVLDDSRARQIGRENRPLLEAARKQATEAINAKEQFGLDSALRKMRQTDTELQQGQDSLDQKAYQYGRTMQHNKDRLAFDKSKGDDVKLTNKAGDIISARAGADGYYYDQQGNRLGSEWYKYDKPTGSSRYGYGAASKTELDALYKKINKMSPALNAARDVNEMLSDYAVGGKYENVDDMSGVGAVSGASTLAGSAARWFEKTFGSDADSEEAQQNKQRVSRFASLILKQQAGASQTMHETRKILEGLGLSSDNTDLVDEVAFVRAWPKIQQAIQNDLADIRATTTDAAYDHYMVNNTDAKTNIFSEENRFKPLDMKNRDGSAEREKQQQDATVRQNTENLSGALLPKAEEREEYNPTPTLGVLKFGDREGDWEYIGDPETDPEGLEESSWRQWR